MEGVAVDFGLGYYLFLALVRAAFLAASACPFYKRKRNYEKSSYHRLTSNDYAKARRDRGLWGEYKLCCEIERSIEDPRILMNVYVPRGDGTTSECDLVLVGRTGIWVFENKNYSGWKFGNGKQRMWTQSLNKAIKERFYNPLWQNMGHVRVLSAYLGLPEESFVPVWSSARGAGLRR